MATWHASYDLTDTVPTALRVYGNDRRRGAIVVVQHSGHGASWDVLLGGPDVSLALDSYGHRLHAGESLTLTGAFLPDDEIYAVSTAPAGECHVLIVGA